MSKYNFDNYILPFDFSSKLDNGKLTTSPTELALIYCFKCRGCDQSEAYKCNNTYCPLYAINKVYMPKPHRLSKEQKEQLRIQCEINRNKKLQREL